MNKEKKLYTEQKWKRYTFPFCQMAEKRFISISFL